MPLRVHTDVERIAYLGYYKYKDSMLLSHILPHGITVRFGTTGCITVTIWRTTVHDHIVPTNAYVNAHLHGLSFGT